MRAGQKVFLMSAAASQLPSADNNPYTKVAYPGVACFAPFLTHQYKESEGHFFLFTCSEDVCIASTEGFGCLPNFAP